MLRRLICLITMLTAFLFSTAQRAVYLEPYRPQIHYSPKKGWMNDPNGMVYYQGVYHLFYQYYPDSTVWGPMHWGHATSPDLVHWKEEAIALYPDSIGYIFSGSAVVDSLNTSGFGKAGKVPLVAIFTQHDMAGEKAQTNRFQNQGIAYSLDAGKNWIKYSGNPVLRNPGLKDFRDPKVSWYAEQKKWIMTLAAGDRVMFYSSKNLKACNKESEFGEGIGAHGGVWECPDLVPFIVEGKKIWLLLVSINPGGAQGGSSTQYFTGKFDGNHFTSYDTITRWADYGPDNYAGVTWSNTGKEKIFLGWMSNWQYGTKVPTEKWRSAMTIPRVLGLKKIGEEYFIKMSPATTMKSLELRSIHVKPISGYQYNLYGPTRIELTGRGPHSFYISFSNPANKKLIVGFDEKRNAFYIDRRNAGRSDFDEQFAKIHYGPRITQSKNTAISLILDNSSLEIFADQGLTTMTEIFFPDQSYNKMQITGDLKWFESFRISELSSYWKKPN